MFGNVVFGHPPILRPPNVLSFSCGEAPRAGGQSGTAVAATKAVGRGSEVRAAVTPCVLDGQRGFSPGSGERTATSCDEKLGWQSCSAGVSKCECDFHRHERMNTTVAHPTHVIVLRARRFSVAARPPTRTLLGESCADVSNVWRIRSRKACATRERAAGRLAGAARVKSCRGFLNAQPNVLGVSCAAGPACRSRSGAVVAANDVRRTEWRTATAVTPSRWR